LSSSSPEIPRGRSTQWNRKLWWTLQQLRATRAWDINKAPKAVRRSRCARSQARVCAPSPAGNVGHDPSRPGAYSFLRLTRQTIRNKSNPIAWDGPKKTGCAKDLVRWASKLILLFCRTMPPRPAIVREMLCSIKSSWTPRFCPFEWGVRSLRRRGSTAYASRTEIT